MDYFKSCMGSCPYIPKLENVDGPSRQMDKKAECFTDYDYPVYSLAKSHLFRGFKIPAA